MPGVQLVRGEDHTTATDALATTLGGRVGLSGLLADLGRQARPSWPGRLLGLAVDRAYRWDDHDARDRRWWPQGISSSADADDSETVAGRRLLATTWYAKDLGSGSHGSRVTILDLDTLRYEHALLVTPTLDGAGVPGAAPLRVHAGGLVWRGDHLHVAATRRGFVTCHLDDVVRVPADATLRAHGHRFLLPVRVAHGAEADAGVPPFRFSFLSLDRGRAAGGLLAGEYGRAGGATTRLVRFDLTGSGLPDCDPAGRSVSTMLEDLGTTHMQGAVRARGRLYVTTSHGSRWPGSVHVGTPPGPLREHRLAVPMGPEDLTWWPSTDRLWTLTEHPRRRWVVSVPRARVDG